VLWMAFERTGKPTLSEGEPPKARALQWDHFPFSLTGLRMNSRGADRQRLGRANARADDADSGRLTRSLPLVSPCGLPAAVYPAASGQPVLLENGSPQRGLAFC